MLGRATKRGVRVTARRRTESDLAGSDNCCVDCGAELTEAEVRFVYHLRTSPQCGVCGGYDVGESYPAPERMQEQEDFKAWRIEERATELLH
jgi:hypothetical protein